MLGGIFHSWHSTGAPGASHGTTASLSALFPPTTTLGMSGNGFSFKGVPRMLAHHLPVINVRAVKVMMQSDVCHYGQIEERPNVIWLSSVM